MVRCKSAEPATGSPVRVVDHRWSQRCRSSLNGKGMTRAGRAAYSDQEVRVSEVEGTSGAVERGVLSRGSAGGGPTRRAVLRRGELGELVLPHGEGDGLRSGEADSALSGAGIRSVARRHQLSRRRQAPGSDRRCPGWNRLGKIRGRRADAGPGVGWAFGPRRPLSCEGLADAVSQEQGPPPCGGLPSQLSAGSDGALVVLVIPDNCRSRWAARGPRAPVNNRLGERT